jgi:large subunit ribosomal protein L25
MIKKEKTILKAEIRKFFGKKVKKLRKEGLIPANIFGKDFKSKAITINAKEFAKVYKKVKETGVLYLEIEKETLPVLIASVQKHPVTHQLLHVDFKKVDLTQKTQAEVPVEIIGQAPAVLEKGGVLLTLTQNLLVEALPEEIPQSIKVDISTLKDIGQEIKVANLPTSSTYQILTEKEKVIVSVVAHKEESVTPETQPMTAPEIITEKKESEKETKEEPKTQTQTQNPSETSAPKK